MGLRVWPAIPRAPPHWLEPTKIKTPALTLAANPLTIYHLCYCMLPALPPGDPLELYACSDDTLPDHGKHKQRCFVQDDDDTDLMRGDGEEVDDPFYNITPVSLTSIASVLHPSDLSRAYVFCANRM